MLFLCFWYFVCLGIFKLLLFDVVSTSAIDCRGRLSLLCVKRDVKHLLTRVHGGAENQVIGTVSNSIFSRTACVSEHEKGKWFCILMKQEMMGDLLWNRLKVSQNLRKLQSIFDIFFASLCVVLAFLYVSECAEKLILLTPQMFMDLWNADGNLSQYVACTCSDDANVWCCWTYLRQTQSLTTRCEATVYLAKVFKLKSNFWMQTSDQTMTLHNICVLWGT